MPTTAHERLAADEFQPAIIPPAIIQTDSVPSEQAERQVLSEAIARPSRPIKKASAEDKAEKLLEQERLEAAILRYQDALANGRTREINDAYRDVCRIYQPLNFVRTWFRKYRYLFDTREDFIQHYLQVFSCKALAEWKPRHLRGQSRYGGSGWFANYFWSCLSNAYSNMVKKDAAGKRNLSCKCPICHAWSNPLSTHLYDHHEELLWARMEKFGMDVNALDNCPFCKSHKVPRTVHCEHAAKGCDACLSAAVTDALKNHLKTVHSAYLFEQFHEMFPEHVTLSSKEASVYMADTREGDDENNLYDDTADETRLHSLLALNLSDLQKQIVHEGMFARRPLTYSPAVYNCTSEEFAAALDGLRTMMSLCGMEG